METQRKMRESLEQMERSGAPVHGMPCSEAVARLRAAIELRERILRENAEHADRGPPRVPGVGGGG